MYLYFDRNLVLKEIINDKALRQGNFGVNDIYVYIDIETTVNTLFVRYKLPDDTLIPEFEVTDKVTTTVPYNPKQDLKYFRYGKPYRFFKVPTELNTQWSALELAGNVACSLRIAGVDTLGLIVFNVEESAEGMVIAPEEYLSLAQFNYLVGLMTEYQDMIFKVIELDEELTLNDLFNRSGGAAILKNASTYYLYSGKVVMTGLSYRFQNLQTGEFIEGQANEDTLVSILLENDFQKYLVKSDNENIVYANDSNGDETEISYGTAVQANEIVQRDSNGDVLVPDVPFNNNGAASKKFIEGRIVTRANLIGSNANITNEELEILKLTNSLIILNNQVFYKQINVYGGGQLVVIVFRHDDTIQYNSTTGTYIIPGETISVDVVNKTLSTSGQQSITVYSKAKTDELLGDKQNVIDSSHKLASDLVDDTNQTNKFVTTAEKTYWNSKANKTYVDNSFAHSIDLTIDSNYDLVVKLLDAGGHVLSQDDVDLPLESIVVSATYYDSYTYGGTTYSKVIVIVLATTSVPTIVPVGDLVSGLATTTDLTNGLATKQNVIDSSHKLSADLVENGTTNKVFTATEQTKLSGIESGAEVNVLEGVQLNGTDLTITDKKVDITGVQDTLVSGTNIKTINGESVLGSGNLEVTADLDDYAKVDGNYPTMTVGSADNLTPYGENSGANDTTPFVFQSTGGNSDVGIKAYLKALRGNSVAWNQLANITGTSETINGITFTNNNDGSWTISGVATANIYKPLNAVTTIKTHRFLVKGATSKVGLYVYDKAVMNQDTIFTYNGNTVNNYLLFYIASGTDVSTPIKVIPQLFELTMFEQNGTTYNSVLQFNRDYPKPYYPYNAGTLLSCKVNGIKNVWYNAFDGQWESGGISSDGSTNTNNNYCRTKNFIQTIAGSQYSIENGSFVFASSNSQLLVCEYDGNQTFIKRTALSYFIVANTVQKITLSDNTHYIKFVLYSGGTAITTLPSENTFSCHLTWDESRTGYEPYESKTYQLPNVELRSAGSVYDELTPDGTLITRIGVVDLGTLSWNNNESFASGLFSATVSGMNNTTESSERNKGIACSKYIPSSVTALNNNIPDKTMLRYNGQIFIRDSAFAGKTTDEVKALVNGVYLNYELATPTETQYDNYQYQEIQDIDDFGTQEFLYDSNIAIPVPQGNEFFYPVDYKAFIDSLGGREDIEYSANKIVSQTQLANYLKTISGYNATKTQTLKNVNGTFTWVDD